jgi:tetratricopeptide (TPR) repeat protein
VAYKRFEEAKAAGQPEPAVLGFLNTAVSRYHKALKLLPPNAVDNLAIVHNALGAAYMDGAGDIDSALPHFRKAIRYFEAADDLYHSALVRCNVASSLARNGRLADARDYAAAALRNFEQFGPGAASDVEKTRQLQTWIDSLG